MYEKITDSVERDIIFDYLRPFRKKIMEVFRKKGTRKAVIYIYVHHKIKLKGREVREFLGAPTNNGAKLAQEAHRMAWTCAGWNGCMPVALASKKTELLQIGLIRKDEKMVIV